MFAEPARVLSDTWTPRVAERQRTPTSANQRQRTPISANVRQPSATECEPRDRFIKYAIRPSVEPHVQFFSFPYRRVLVV